MKNYFLGELARSLECSISTTRNEAILKAAILFERAFFLGGNRDGQDEILGGDLAAIDVQPTDLHSIREALIKLMNSHQIGGEEKGLVIWALGKALDVNTAKSIENYTARESAGFSEEIAYQVAIALDNFRATGVTQTVDYDTCRSRLLRVGQKSPRIAEIIRNWIY